MGFFVWKVDDLQRFGALIRERYAGKYAIFVGGQSMGSLVSVHAVLRDQSVWDGLVLATATLDVEWNTSRRWVY
jgi:alpha-beta hydrolase superfamily lysophospholipase